MLFVGNRSLMGLIVSKKRFLEDADKKTSNFLFVLTAWSWCIWLIRNDLVFNNVVISSPEFGVYQQC